MFHYAKEPGEEQHLGTNDLKFREFNTVCIITVENLTGSHCVV